MLRFLKSSFTMRRDTLVEHLGIKRGTFVATHCNTLQHTVTHRESGAAHDSSALSDTDSGMEAEVVDALEYDSVMLCSMLQCVAVCCSVLQCVAVCCTVLQYVAVCCSVLQCFALCCSMLQCVAVI